MLRYGDVKHLNNYFGQAQVNKFNYLLNKINEMLNQKMSTLLGTNEQFKIPMILIYGHCVHFLIQLMSLLKVYQLKNYQIINILCMT